MRAQDIKVGEHYAIGRGDRAVVLEIGHFESETFTWGRWRPANGVRAHKVRPDGSEHDPPNHDVVVTLAQVKSTWADHEAYEREMAEAKRRTAEMAQQGGLDACVLRDRLLVLTAVEAKIDPYGSSFTLGASDMRTLIGLLEQGKWF